VSNAIFTFITLDKNNKPVSVKEVIREDVFDYIKELL
jgi:hypothetical protein